MTNIIGIEHCNRAEHPQTIGSRIATILIHDSRVDWNNLKINLRRCFEEKVKPIAPKYFIQGFMAKIQLEKPALLFKIKRIQWEMDSPELFAEIKAKCRDFKPVLLNYSDKFNAVIN